MTTPFYLDIVLRVSIQRCSFLHKDLDSTTSSTFSLLFFSILNNKNVWHYYRRHRPPFHVPVEELKKKFGKIHIGLRTKWEQLITWLHVKLSSILAACHCYDWSKTLLGVFMNPIPCSFLWAAIYYQADHFPRNYDALFWISEIKLAELQEIETY